MTILDRRELRDLWVSIGIAISLSVYHLCFNLVQAFQYLTFECARLVNHLMFVWILGLLWIAYRRYRDAVIRQAELQNILTSISTEVIMVVDPKRRIRMVNESISMFGYTPREVTGRTTDLLYDDRRTDARHPHEVRDAIEVIGFHIGVATGRRADGAPFPLEIVTASLKGDEGAVVVIKDITERRRAEEELLRAKERAEAADAAKGRMLSELEGSYEKLRQTEAMRDNLTHMIVHDMRTPLQVILSNLELLERFRRRNPEPRDDERRMLGEAMHHTQRLADMTNAVLDVSRLENQRFPLHPAVWDADALADECVAGLAPILGDLRIRCEKQRGGAVVEADREVIRRVLTNLLSNAIKYAPPGSAIVLDVRRENDAVRFTVTDSGPGIAPEEQPRIFEKFAQGGQRPLRKTHGAGIGLAFCRLAVEAHGGNIGVASENGGGSSFWFRIPVKAAVPAAA